MTGRGFTLVEVLVALVVLEVGILGVLGSLLLAARTLRRTEELERAVGEVQRVYDSLAAVPGPVGEARVASGPGEVRWEGGGGGRIVVRFVHGDSVVAGLSGISRASYDVW